MEKGVMETIYETFLKVWVLLLYILLGTVGKFSYNMLNGKILTWQQSFGQLGVCLLCGTLAYMFCGYMGWLTAQAIVTTTATFVSDKIMLAVYTLDWQRIVNNIFDSFKKK